MTKLQTLRKIIFCTSDNTSIVKWPVPFLFLLEDQLNLFLELISRYSNCPLLAQVFPFPSHLAVLVSAVLVLVTPAWFVLENLCERRWRRVSPFCTVCA